jgi:transposase
MHILEEERLALSAAAKRIGVHVSTIWRWALRGCRGHKLETRVVGWQRYTSVEALKRFVDRINGDPDSPGGLTAQQRERAIEQAERELGELRRSSM